MNRNVWLGSLVMLAMGTAQAQTAQITAKLPELLDSGYEVVTMTSTMVDKYARPGENELALILKNAEGSHFICKLVTDGVGRIRGNTCMSLNSIAPNN